MSSVGDFIFLHLNFDSSILGLIYYLSNSALWTRLQSLLPITLTQNSELRESSRGDGDSPCRLICQPCEPSGQGLVMWFRWVSHAGVSLPSPLSAPATVPHYTPCQRQRSCQRAWQFLTTGFLLGENGEKWEVIWRRLYRIRNVTIWISFLLMLEITCNLHVLSSVFNLSVDHNSRNYVIFFHTKPDNAAVQWGSSESPSETLTLG